MISNLSIVIVNRDNKEDTADCIDSLVKAGGELSDIIVVDNGSKDGSVEFLSEKFLGKIQIIVAKENFGYPYGLNLGITHALAEGKQWFLLLNNDTVVAENFLDEISDVVENEPQYSLFAPMILYYTQPHIIWFMGSQRLFGTMLITNQHRGKSDTDQYPKVLSVDFVHGCAMLVKRTVFETIGFFDDASPIYGDDVDFSWRAQLAGFKMAAVPRAKMWHKVSAFMQHHKPMSRYLRIRNQIWFYRRYAKGLGVFFIFLFTFFRSIVMIVKDLIFWQPQLISPLIFGFYHGWRGTGNKKF